MDALLRRLGAASTIGVAVLVALPAGVAADCNGPGCGAVDPPADGLVIAVTVAIMVAFFTVMAVAEARRR